MQRRPQAFSLSQIAPLNFSAVRRLVLISTTAAALMGCGVVNGFGGPWPPTSSTDDGGPPANADGGCNDGTHNGGDGACLPDGECSTGFTSERDGRCSTWSIEATISPARALLSLAVLDDGRVLALGGKSATAPVADAQLYDPETGTWVRPSGTITARHSHRAVSIAGNRVLIVGGRTIDDALLPETALYRVDQDAVVAGGALSTPRDGHAVLELTTTTLVTVGGVGANGATLSSIEKLSAGVWSSAGVSLATARRHFAAVNMEGGALIAGGLSGSGAPLNSVERIALGDALSVIAASPMVDARSHATATLLNNGRVLVVGGYTDSAAGLASLRTAELYDPAADAWEDAGQLTIPRAEHGAVLLADGRVLVAGGFGVDGTALTSVEIFDPTTNAFSEGPTMASARGAVALAALDDGGALVVQGSLNRDHTSVVTTTERYRVVD